MNSFLFSLHLFLQELKSEIDMFRIDLRAQAGNGSTVAQGLSSALHDGIDSTDLKSAPAQSFRNEALHFRCSSKWEKGREQNETSARSGRDKARCEREVDEIKREVCERRVEIIGEQTERGRGSNSSAKWRGGERETKWISLCWSSVRGHVVTCSRSDYHTSRDDAWKVFNLTIWHR